VDLTRDPAAIVDAAALEIRALNHRTLAAGGEGWQYPGDAYSAVGGLVQLAMMLPQALDQIGDLLEGMDIDGNLRSDKDTLTADLENTYGGLADAHDAAKKLYEALNRAHSGLSPITYKD